MRLCVCVHTAERDKLEKEIRQGEVGALVLIREKVSSRKRGRGRVSERRGEEGFVFMD